MRQTKVTQKKRWKRNKRLVSCPSKLYTFFQLFLLSFHSITVQMHTYIHNSLFPLVVRVYIFFFAADTFCWPIHFIFVSRRKCSCLSMTFRRVRVCETYPCMDRFVSFFIPNTCKKIRFSDVLLPSFFSLIWHTQSKSKNLEKKVIFGAKYRYTQNLSLKSLL